MKAMRLGLFGILLSLPLFAWADDTDIYIDNGALGNGGEALVMFTLDYRSNLGSVVCQNSGDNWGNCQSLVTDGYLAATDQSDGKISFFEMMRAVLKKVLTPLSGLRVGLMINHNNENNCVGSTATRCSNGSYVRLGFKSFESGDGNGAKAAFNQALSDLGEPSGNLAHAFQGKELFFEFFRYLTGQGWYNAHNGYKDFGDSNQNSNLNVDFPLRSWDATVESGANYVTPLMDDFNCSKIFTLNLMFQVSQQEDDSDSAITATKASGGMSGISLAGNNNNFPTVIKWLYDQDIADGSYGTVSALNGKQNVTSFFLVDETKINTTTTAYATAGGTIAPYALSSNPDTLYNNLVSIFNQILSTSTTFVAASVPVNVFNRTQIMDSVYIAIFQADDAGKPLWNGNIKKLKLATDVNGLTILVDAGNADAVALDGRIKDGALTYWTNASGADVVAADTAAGEVSGKDGRSVARGGAGQKIPGFLTGTVYTANATVGGRKLYTEPASYTNGTPTALRAFDSATVAAAVDVQSALGVASAANATTLINFARGMDLSDFDGDTQTSDLRPWLLGDPLHSRVLPVNYGAQAGYSTTYPHVRLLMGSNDGFMRLFQDTDGAGSQLGVESWGFMPLTVMGQVSRLKANTAGSPKHPYLVDGAAVTYSKDNDGDGTIETGDTVYSYFGLRRGGRNYYALDITTPDTPMMLWSIKQDVGTDFSQLGYTFSYPRVRKLSYTVGGTTYNDQPVLIFGGGYDTNKDNNVLPGTDDTMGNAIFVVNAATGELVWKAVYGPTTGPDGSNNAIYYHVGLQNSIPSELTTLDGDLDGRVDRAYVGDSGGDVWRVDLAGNDRSQWQLGKILSLGRGYDNTAASDRRFFHRPDVVRFKDGAGYYDAVIIGSGDREDPLDKNDASTKVVNWIYMYKDRNTTSGIPPTTPLTHGDLADLTDDCLQDSTPCPVPINLTNGWRVQMESNGEKVLSAPLTISGVIYFTTYIPPGGVESTTCGPMEGTGALYMLSLEDAAAPPPVDPVTGEVNEGATLSKADRKDDLTSGGIPADVVALPPDRILRPDLAVQKINAKSFWKTYWYHSNE